MLREGHWISRASAHQRSPMVPAYLPMQREGLELGASLSLLTQLTAGLSGGQLLTFVQQLAARVLQAGAADGGQAGEGSTPAGQQPQRPRLQLAASVEEVALELLPMIAPVSKGEVQALQAWTATVHSPLPPEVRGGRGGPREGLDCGRQAGRQGRAGSEMASNAAATCQPNQFPCCCLCPPGRLFAGAAGGSTEGGQEGSSQEEEIGRSCEASRGVV